MARWARLELATDGLENRCSVQLSYHRVRRADKAACPPFVTAVIWQPIHRGWQSFFGAEFPYRFATKRIGTELKLAGEYGPFSWLPGFLLITPLRPASDTS